MGEEQKEVAKEVGKNVNFGKMLLYAFIAAAIVLAVINFDSIKSFASDEFSKATSAVSSFVSPQISSIISTEQYYKGFSTSVENPVQREYVKVTFKNTAVKNNEINVDAAISVMNKDISKIDMNAECYAGSDTLTAVPSSVSFEKSDAEQHSTITCSGTSSDKHLDLKLQMPFVSTCKATASVGEGPAEGLMGSVRDFNSPYNLAVNIEGDMPFKYGSLQYPVYITLSKDAGELATLKQINLLKIWTLDTVPVKITCPGFSQNGKMLQIENVENVNDWLASEGVYQIRCTLSVEKPTTYGKYFINAEADYVAEQEFKKTLT